MAYNKFRWWTKGRPNKPLKGLVRLRLLKRLPRKQVRMLIRIMGVRMSRIVFRLLWKLEG